MWKTYEAKSIVQYNRLITLQYGHLRRVWRMKNGGVWKRLAGSFLGTRQIYLCGAVRYPVILTFPAFLPRTTPFLLTVAIFVLEDFHFGLRFAPSIFRVIILLTYTVAVFFIDFWCSRYRNCRQRQA